MSAGRSSFTMSLDTSGLRALMAELGEVAAEEVRPAAQAGAQVLYEEVRRNAMRLGRKTGNLANSIYQAYSRDQSGPMAAAYHVSWRTGREKDANGKPVPGPLARAPHGHLIEYGYMQRYAVFFDDRRQRFVTVKSQPLAAPKQVPAKPFVRPAASKFPQALKAMEDHLMAKLQAKLEGKP